MTAPEPERRATSARDRHALSISAAELPPADVAERLEALPEAERAQLLGSIPPDRRPAVFSHLSCDAQASLVRALDRRTARQLLEQLETDDRTRFFAGLPEDEREAALDLLGPEARADTARLLQYPPDSVGRLMSLTFAAVPEDWPVADALDHLRRLQLDPDAIATIYITDTQGRLIDALNLARLALAHPSTRVRDLMDGIYVTITATEDREQAVRLMQRHDLIGLPVVDATGELVGVVTVDDVMDVAEEETTEDFERQAGIAPLRATYPDVPARALFQKRLPWLAALIFVYLGASGVISAFEDALAAEIVLAAFIPLLMGSGGNVGAQSGTLIVRALALGELAGDRWLMAVRKEVGVGIALGLALGILAGIVALARGGTGIAVVVGSAMVIIVVTANLTGTLLPVLLTKVGVDPAVAGSPVITSVTDLSSLVIYLGLASLLLGL